jgi:DNA polymerase-3 subunit delta
MRNINEDIKNHQFKKIYLLYGEEGYLKKQYRDRLKKAVCGEDTMNYAYFEGKGINVNEVIAMADTMPFFAEQRLVVVENSGFFKNTNEKLSEYIGQIPDSTVMVFVEEETDKRSKLFKKAKETGYVCEMAKQTPAILSKWALQIVHQAGKSITSDTMDYFLAAAGNDMNHISMELEKLITYTMDRDVITKEDINEICTVLTVSKIFDMIDAMGSKNRKKALDLYYDMIEVKEPPMRILYMLSRQFNLMLQAKELREHGVGAKELAAKMGVAPFVANKALHQSEKFHGTLIKQALTECLKVEEDVKNGRLEDKIAVELILIRYAS